MVFTAMLAVCMAVAPSTKDLEEHARAAQELRAMISRAGAGGDMPRVTDARVARLLLAISDERRFLSSPFPADGIGPSLKLCGRTTEVMVAYMMSGTGSLAGIDPGTAARRTQAVMAKNARSYQDELALLMPFAVRCEGRLAGAMAEWLQARGVAGLTDVQRQGLAQVRLGILQIYVGALMSGADGGLKESFRERLLGAAADAASASSAISTLEGRRSVLEALRSVHVGRSLEPHVARIRQEMGRTDCKGLCSL